MMSDGQYPTDFSDMVLSDMHVSRQAVCVENDEENLSVSRFFFIISDGDVCKGNPEAQDEEGSKQRSGKICFDEDGDLITNRNNERKSFDVINLAHKMATPLMNVGQQVWKGAFVLSDFILHEQNRFKNKTILELGAGIGMCSIVAGMSAKCVFSTDTGESILNICRKNIDENARLLFNGADSVKVRELNWLENNLKQTESKQAYSWTSEDLNSLDKLEILFAADVIYDNDLTDALFDTILKLTKKSKMSSISIFLAVEKRLNFTLEDLDIACPAYNYFLKCLSNLCDGSSESETYEADGKQNFKLRQIDCTFPQYFNYERVKELELWEIQCDKAQPSV